MIQEDSLFNKNYEQALEHLKTRAGTRKLSRKEIENELDALYKYEGLDWAGRGELKRIEIESSILAYQVFLLEYMDSVYLPSF